jgi:acyl transferase domain-containing protein/aryl carrier-like protein
MGRTLDARYPVFRAAIDRCASVLDDRLPVPLRTLLFDEVEGAARINQTECTQPALFAIEFALSELLASWGVRPRAVLGHSVGEYVAAVVAGALPLEGALALIAERGRLMQSLPAGGAMGAIGLPEARVLELLRRFPSLDLAAVNAPSSCVVAGPESDVVALIAEVKATGADATRIAVSHAFHSRLMDPILGQFAQAASGMSAIEPQISVVSNRTGDVIGATQLGDPSYWRDHLRGTVRFADGVATLGRLGIDLIIELGPTPALIGPARESLPGTQYRWVPTMRRGRDEIRSLAECVAGLYVADTELDWQAFHSVQPTRRVSLPTYPWQRERFWKDRRSRDSRSTSIATRWSHPLLGGRLAGPLPAFESEIGLDAQVYLSDHRIFGLPLFPATGFIEMALAGGRESLGDRSLVLRDLSLHSALRVPDTDTVTLQLLLAPGAEEESHTFRVFSRADATTDDEASTWRLHVAGEVSLVRDDPPPPLDLDAIRARCSTTLDVDGYYDRIREFNADYGPAFRGINSLQHAPLEAFGEVRLPENLRESAAAYWMHPALLDACVQLTSAAIGVEAGDEAKQSSAVPVSIGKVRVYQPGATAVWCHFTVPPGTIAGQPTVSCNVTATDATGAIVATLESLIVRRITRSALRAMFAEDRIADSVYQLAWRPKTLEATQEVSPGRWLVLNDEPGTALALADALRAKGHHADLIRLGDAFAAVADGFQIDPARAEDATRLLAAVAEGPSPLRGIVVLWPHACLDVAPSLAALETAQSVVLRSALSLAQAADKTNAPVWFVTRGSQAFPGAAPDVTQAPLWGLGAVVAAENTAARSVRIDLDPLADADAVQPLVDMLLRGDDETVVAFRDATRFVPRLEAATISRREDTELLRLEIPKRGQLENLALMRHPRVAPGPDEVEIEVRAAGLNFRDVLNALGAYPGDPGALGNECAGVVTAVGSNVTGLRVGDSVISMPQGAIATHVVSQAALTVLKPEKLSFAEAATIPVTFLTAHYALHHLGRMKRGDRVLIHAAMGGVGMAAMQIARAAGARIIATAGTSARRARAAALGAEVTADSRSLSFDETVRSGTNGEGVDIVLNSLAGEFIPKGLGLLRPGGHFIEIGKTDVWDEARVAEEFPSLGYHVFFLGELAVYEPQLVRSMLEDLLAGFASGALTPLPQHVFPLEQSEGAFRFMAQAKHSGKIVITPRVPVTIRPDATYLVTGGLTGLGLAVAQSLSAQGARHLLLMGRRAPGADARVVIDALESQGVQVSVASADVADAWQVAAALATISDGMPPLRGIIHAAGLLDDAVLAEMDWNRFSRVLGPKVTGTWNLHEQTQHAPLDFFVNFSSVAALLGSPGQSNYAAANQFLDTLAHARRANGQPALSINWGSWSDVGMAASLGAQHQRRLAAAGLRAISPDDGVRLLQDLMTGAVSPQVAVIPLDFDALKGRLPALLSELAAEQDASSTRDAATAGILDRLRNADADARIELLEAMLGEQIMRVLAADANYQPDWHRTLIELGMDSLMAIELRNRIKTHLEVTVTVGELMAGVTVRELGVTVLERLPMNGAGGITAQSASGAATTPTGAEADWESGSL